MKFKGIAGGKHPTLKKGDVIHLSPEEKVCALAKEQLATHSPEGFKLIPINGVLVGEVNTIIGRQVSGKTDPTQYMGKVRIKYRKLRLKDDRLFPAEEKTVYLHCKDCKNEIGVPDLEVVEFKDIK